MGRKLDKLKVETERREREDVESKAKEEAESREREDAERKAKEGAVWKERVEAEHKAKEEAECREREMAEIKAKEGADHREREEVELFELLICEALFSISTNMLALNSTCAVTLARTMTVSNLAALSSAAGVRGDDVANAREAVKILASELLGAAGKTPQNIILSDATSVLQFCQKRLQFRDFICPKKGQCRRKTM